MSRLNSSKTMNNMNHMNQVVVPATSQNQLPPEEERFAKYAGTMTEAVYESILTLFNAGYKTVDPQLVAFAGMLIKSLEKHQLIHGFISNSHIKCWDSIKRRNEQYFIENASDIFKYLPMDKVELFKDLFNTVDAYGSSVIAQETKDELWDLFDVMVKCAIKYVHKHRQPYSVRNSNGSITEYYGQSFFDEVDLHRHVKTWGLTLEFPLKE